MRVAEIKGTTSTSSTLSSRTLRSSGMSAREEEQVGGQEQELQHQVSVRAGRHQEHDEPRPQVRLPPQEEEAQGVVEKRRPKEVDA